MLKILWGLLGLALVMGCTTGSTPGPGQSDTEGDATVGADNDVDPSDGADGSAEPGLDEALATGSIDDIDDASTLTDALLALIAEQPR